MADVFDITSSGAWTFTAVASTLLKQTTLALAQGDNKVQFAEGPDLKPTHNAKYWAAKTRGFDFSGEDRVPADLYNKILWEGLKGTPAPVPHSRFPENRRGRRPDRCQHGKVADGTTTTSKPHSRDTGGTIRFTPVSKQISLEGNYL